MRLSVILRTQDFRGDHGADVGIAHELLAGETVEGLAARLLDRQNAYAPDQVAVIEIRRVVEAPEPAPEKHATPFLCQPEAHVFLTPSQRCVCGDKVWGGP